MECWTWFRFDVTQMVCNLLTDIYLMAIFWILLLKLKVPIAKYVQFLASSLPVSCIANNA